MKCSGCVRDPGAVSTCPEFGHRSTIGPRAVSSVGRAHPLQGCLRGTGDRHRRSAHCGFLLAAPNAPRRLSPPRPPVSLGSGVDVRDAFGVGFRHVSDTRFLLSRRELPQNDDDPRHGGSSTSNSLLGGSGGGASRVAPRQRPRRRQRQASPPCYGKRRPTNRNGRGCSESTRPRWPPRSGDGCFSGCREPDF